MIEQSLHRGIEPVPITQLESQALLQVASKDAGGIELLEALQNPLDPVFPATEEPRHPVETSAKIAILIEQIEKVQRDNSVALVTRSAPICSSRYSRRVRNRVAVWSSPGRPSASKPPLRLCHGCG